MVRPASTASSFTIVARRDSEFRVSASTASAACSSSGARRSSAKWAKLR